MEISKRILPIALAVSIGTTALAAKRDWNQGTLLAVEVLTMPIKKNKVGHRYQCVVSDGTYSYTVEYDHPVKTAVHDPVKFAIHKDSLVLVDLDGKERSARIEKRERVIAEPPGR
jgi:hypothetical protein